MTFTHSDPGFGSETKLNLFRAILLSSFAISSKVGHLSSYLNIHLKKHILMPQFEISIFNSPTPNVHHGNPCETTEASNCTF